MARTSVKGTKFSALLSTLDNVQGCEYPVVVVFFADESNKSFSNLLEMCSRAQYKLFLVIENNFQLVQGEALELSKFLTNEELQKFSKSHPFARPQQVFNAIFNLLRETMECVMFGLIYLYLFQLEKTTSEMYR